MINKKAQLNRGIALFLFIIVGFAVFDVVYYIHSTKYYEDTSWGELGIYGISGMAAGENKITAKAISNYDSCTKETRYNKVLRTWAKSKECRKLDRDKPYCYKEVIANKENLICVECFNGAVGGEWKVIGCGEKEECNKNHECEISTPNEDPNDDYNNYDNPDKRCDYSTEEGRKACEKFGLECKKDNKCGSKDSNSDSEDGNYDDEGNVDLECNADQEMKLKNGELECVDRENGSCTLADRFIIVGWPNCVQYADEIIDNSKNDILLIAALMFRESSCNTNAVSNKGAYGLMQITSNHYKEYGYNSMSKFANDLKSKPSFNIQIGNDILNQCLEKCGNVEGALTCYNRGINHENACVTSTFSYRVIESKDKLAGAC